MYIEEFDEFITDEESDELIAIVENSAHKLTTLGGGEQKHRIAYGSWVENSNPIADYIKTKIADYLDIPKENMERIQLVRYPVGGEYKPHYDGFHKNTNYYDPEIDKGGQRKLTALIYLNEDFKGGETAFPKLGITVTPQKNKLIAWGNLKKTGELDHDSLHAGLPVTEGVKYIAVVWIRENKFTG